jgi:hypothetical protein
LTVLFADAHTFQSFTPAVCYTLTAMVAVVVGTMIEKWLYDDYLEWKGGKQYRTAMCVRGRFYYVIPEAEYCDEIRPALARDWSRSRKAGLAIHETVADGEHPEPEGLLPAVPDPSEVNTAEFPVFNPDAPDVS